VTPTSEKCVNQTSQRTGACVPRAHARHSHCSCAPSARQTAAAQPLCARQVGSGCTGMQNEAAPATVADCIPSPPQLQPAENAAAVRVHVVSAGRAAVQHAACIRENSNGSRAPATFVIDLRAKWKLSAVTASNSPPLMPCKVGPCGFAEQAGDSATSNEQWQGSREDLLDLSRKTAPMR